MTPKQALDEAREYLSLGYFAGALERALLVDQQGEYGASARLVVWLARVYLGPEHHDAAWNMRETMYDVSSQFAGGQGLAEAAWLANSSGKLAAARRLIESIIDTADAQHGVLVSWHPTAILALAELLADQQGGREQALRLTNLALGWRSVFASLSDVHRLARLLVRVNAPTMLWADWSAIFIRHIQFAAARATVMERHSMPSDAHRWARSENAASEHVLTAVLSEAPAILLATMKSLAPHLGVADFANVLERFAPRALLGGHEASDIWFEPAVMRYRYFWYDMLTSSEQDFVRNGEFAFIRTPTQDFSMAVAQWWRVLESVLKRSLLGLLIPEFKAHPEWAEWDELNLSERSREKERLFLEAFSDPEKSRKMTLGDLLLLLQKCESTSQHRTGSKLRHEASRMLAAHSQQIGSLTKGDWLNPAHLSTENIGWFRNRASHDSSVDEVGAATGRILSRRILDGFYAPVLKRWGFKPGIW